MNLAKLVRILLRPGLARTMALQRIAAGVEHLDVIGYTCADLLVDVGANKGQFSLAFRYGRPGARIVAFEPIPGEADRFAELFADDTRVSLQRVALSDTSGVARFYVTDRKDSSSLLVPGKNQADIYGVKQGREIEVNVDTLDNCLAGVEFAKKSLLKIDVQGAELGVLAGCTKLRKFAFIYVEISFIELYEGQALFPKIYEHLEREGFALIGLFNQDFSPTNGPIQADALFHRVDDFARPDR